MKELEASGLFILIDDISVISKPSSTSQIKIYAADTGLALFFKTNPNARFMAALLENFVLLDLLQHKTEMSIYYARNEYDFCFDETSNCGTKIYSKGLRVEDYVEEMLLVS